MKIGLISLGCPKNLVDSEVMLGLVRQAGHTITTDASEADLILVNTCAFIESAKQESIDAILEAAEQRGRGARLVVTGCLAERYRGDLQREMPEIDVVLGIDEVPDIVKAIAGAGPRPKARVEGGSGARDAAVHASFFRRSPGTLPTYIYDAETPRLRATPSHYAYLKIAEGCDYTCAFCIIPKLRGAYRSRTADSILGEAGRLVEEGAKEIILISQDTTFYGVDRGERGAIGRLLREMNRLEGLEWIRLLYLYPTTVGEDLLSAMAECEKVCKYIDLPLQHASPAVLKRMNRPGDGERYARLLRHIRERVPGVALRSTFIVGFPGETDAEFEQLLDFVGEVRFDHVGVFTYSHEEGTPAFPSKDDVPAAVKESRREAIMRLQRQVVADRNRELIGRHVRVIVDGPFEHELVLKGRLESEAPDIDPVVYLSNCDPSQFIPGSMVRAEVVSAHGYDLVVRPLDEWE